MPRLFYLFILIFLFMKHSKNFYLIAAQNKGGTVFNGTHVAARTVTPLGTANDRNGGENPFVFTSPPMHGMLIP
jgi:hypothetical protein